MNFVVSTLWRAYASAARPIARRLYRSGLKVLAKEAWRNSLLDAVCIGAGDRVLDLGISHMSVADELDLRCPHTSCARVVWNHFSKPPAAADLANATSTLTAVTHPRLRIEAAGGSFDIVIAPLVLHELGSSTKAALLKEIYRLLRRGGTAYWAELDRPQSYSEHTYLALAAASLPGTDFSPHMDGSWVQQLGETGFRKVVQVASVSCSLARVTVVRARR